MPVVLAWTSFKRMPSLAGVQRLGIHSFAGFVLDPAALGRIVAARDPRWFVDNMAIEDAGVPLSVIRLKGRALSLAHGLELVLEVDPSRPANIRRADVKLGLWYSRPHVSAREDFDASGFPRRWVVESLGGDPIRRTVRFREVEWGAMYDPDVVFSATLPPGCWTSPSP